MCITYNLFVYIFQNSLKCYVIVVTARVRYVFLSILLVLENCNFRSLSPWKVLEFCPFSLLWTLYRVCISVIASVCLFRLYLKIVLGSVNVSLLSKHDKYVCSRCIIPSQFFFDQLIGYWLLNDCSLSLSMFHSFVLPIQLSQAHKTSLMICSFIAFNWTPHLTALLHILG